MPCPYGGWNPLQEHRPTIRGDAATILALQAGAEQLPHLHEQNLAGVQPSRSVDEDHAAACSGFVVYEEGIESLVISF